MPLAWKTCRFCAIPTLHNMGICPMNQAIAAAEAYARLRLNGRSIEDARKFADVVEVALSIPNPNNGGDA